MAPRHKREPCGRRDSVRSRWSRPARRPTEAGPGRGQEARVSAQTIYARRRHFGSLERPRVKLLRQLEQENGRLKNMVADRNLEFSVLSGIIRRIVLGARVRRQQVAYAEGRDLSCRLACALTHRSALVLGRYLAAIGRSSTRCADLPASSAPGVSPDPDLLRARARRDEPRPAGPAATAPPTRGVRASACDGARVLPLSKALCWMRAPTARAQVPHCR